MPFTKAVYLYLDEESLEGIEIVDTAGFNDCNLTRGANKGAFEIL